MRRFVVQLHLWLGLASGVYIFVVCGTGAALLFRIDLQRARQPHLFTPLAAGSLVEPVTVMERVSRAYPSHRLSGVEAPTSRRPTYLAYVTKDRAFATVLIDPVSARILGELPPDPLIESLQRLHFDLMGGRIGRSVNGIGAVCILVMCGTGVVIWWPGRKQWRRGFVVDLGRDARRIVWEFHRAIGIWTVAFLVMFAITGLSLVFPAQFRAAIGVISPITESRAPTSVAAPANDSRPTWADVIARARQHRPGEHVARVVLPFNQHAPFLVMFSQSSPTPAGTELSSVYLDQYSGEVIAAPVATRTAGDLVIAWVTPLHVAGFGGVAVRCLWAVFALGPPALFLSGVAVWWTRVVRPRVVRP